MLDEKSEDDARTLQILSRRLSPAFSLQNLRYALAAADYGSFRRAAEGLLLRQSTLSRCVRQLEELIGMAVFERSSGGVRATQAGRQFLRGARFILEQVEALAARTQSMGCGEAGRLAVGFYTSLAAEGLEVDTFVRGLIATSLVARNGTKLTLTTVNCACLLLPDGRRIAADNNTGRLERWVDRFMKERRSCSATSDGEKT